MSEKKVQDELKESVHKIWLAGLGAVALTEEKGAEFFKGLVERGESYKIRMPGEEQLKEVKEKLTGARDKARERAGSTFDKFEGKIDEAVSGAMRRLGVPGRDEIATLTKRVEELTRVVEQLRPAPGKKESAKKAAEVN